MQTDPNTKTPLTQAYLMASLMLADEIDARDFSLRELKVLGAIRKRSFGSGYLDAYFPHEKNKWAGLSAATRISEGNLSAEEDGIVQGLKRQQVIEEPVEGFYGFRWPASQWLVPLRSNAENARQLELGERPPSLPSAMREVFLDQAGAHPGQDPRRPMPEAGGRSVPESGTLPPADIPFPNRERPASLGKIEESGLVPESGTPHATMQQCVKDIVLEHFCNVACPVPESGIASKDGADQEEKSGRLNDYQQRLFDECGEIGAFGRDNESRACWFGFAQTRPAVLDWLLGEYRYAKKLGRVKRGAGPFMMNKWIWAGRPDK